jgi:hypothetical protein
MKLVSIILLVCCVGQILSVTEELPRDEALEKPIMEIIPKSNSCAEYKPLIQAYLTKFSSAFTNQDSKKICTFTCNDDDYFGRVIKYCRENKCDFEKFISGLGEKRKLFDCDVNKAKYNFQKLAGKVMLANPKALSCSGDDLKCFLKLILAGEKDCTKYNPYMQKKMNEHVKEHGYGECSLICAKKEANERWNGIVTYAQNELLAGKKKDISFTELNDALKDKKDALQKLYDDVMHSIFKRSGNQAVYDCKVKPKDSSRKLK